MKKCFKMEHLPPPQIKIQRKCERKEARARKCTVTTLNGIEILESTFVSQSEGKSNYTHMHIRMHIHLQ